MFRVLLAVCAIVWFGASSASAQSPPPAAAFGRLPAIQKAVLSPDGKTIAILGGTPGRRLISLSPIDAATAAQVNLGKVDVRDIRWAGNGYLIIQTSRYETGRDPGSNRPFAYHFVRNVVIDASGKVLNQLLVDNANSQYTTVQPILGVLDGPRPSAVVEGLDLAGEALAARNSRIHTADNVLISTLYRVDVATGKGAIIERGSQKTQSWDVDLAGEARVRWDIDPVTRQRILYARAKGTSGWKVFDRARYDLPLDQAVVGYSDPDDAIILLKAGGEGVQVVRHSLADGSETVLGPQTPSLQPQVFWDTYLDKPVAIITGDERPVYQWLDPQLGAVHAKLSRVFKGKAVTLSSWSRDRSRYLVRVDAPSAVPQWMLFEAASNQVSPIGPEYPQLADTPMGPTRWLTYKARDGLDIPAYLTLPPGLAAGAKPPLVVLPHGGPASRDEFGFDWWVQFLASRGYAVLQPQFRGSGGFGDAFERAGDGEWAGKMQTDLLDGIAHLAKEGVVDPARVCIVGASYGGYAALAGVALHPGDYRCAVSVAGVSDVGLMILDTRREGGDSPELQYWRRVAGDSRVTSGILAASSPAKLADRIKAPVLLIHGEEDTVVDINQSRVMDSAMKAAGGDVQFIVLPGDDHYLSSSETRTRMLESVEVFLTRHLPVTP